MKQFYVGVGALIERDGKFLTLKRSEEKDFGAGVWEIVTGRLEADESPQEGMLREVEEEVGLKVEIVMPVDTGFFYRGGKEYPMVFIVYWCRYLDGEARLSWEHTEYKWIDLEEAIEGPDLVHFSEIFAKIKILKEHLPEDFRLP